MIFVTVGTHEQQFNRLIEEIDKLKADGIIEEDVFIQTGFSTYQPKFCESKKLISYNEMKDYIKKAEIIVTHGGPSTFMSVIMQNKKPIVVPRKFDYGEHINNHQLDFCKKVQLLYDNIFLVENVSDLVNFFLLPKENFISSEIKLNNKNFCNKLEEQINLLF